MEHIRAVELLLQAETQSALLADLVRAGDPDLNHGGDAGRRECTEQAQAGGLAVVDSPG